MFETLFFIKFYILYPSLSLIVYLVTHTFVIEVCFLFIVILYSDLYFPEYTAVSKFRGYVNLLSYSITQLISATIMESTGSRGMRFFYLYIPILYIPFSLNIMDIFLLGGFPFCFQLFILVLPLSGIVLAFIYVTIKGTKSMFSRLIFGPLPMVAALIGILGDIFSYCSRSGSLIFRFFANITSSHLLSGLLMTYAVMYIDMTISHSAVTLILLSAILSLFIIGISIFEIFVSIIQVYVVVLLSSILFTETAR